MLNNLRSKTILASLMLLTLAASITPLAKAGHQNTTVSQLYQEDHWPSKWGVDIEDPDLIWAVGVWDISDPDTPVTIHEWETGICEPKIGVAFTKGPAIDGVKYEIHVQDCESPQAECSIWFVTRNVYGTYVTEMDAVHGWFNVAFAGCKHAVGGVTEAISYNSSVIPPIGWAAILTPMLAVAVYITRVGRRKKIP